ncbi:amino acid ABC transporter substrate-binding protein [Acidovorax sp. Leaf84]|jgi:general L-amino acid transport system substrate-binding protein|uniref:amino acid ABC transporter substrate-binding protein n=1 Tax=unclassified Acidovorax TaxID=2684926 RepID=UPI000700341A|nr:amino acid ABC transporter substrate-binding protein [Acidovorax sp. Leaf84]KQO39397.1 amino acid ABC transporter substrate-binding protein [Acidovorax sp. Leaf84]
MKTSWHRIAVMGWAALAAVAAVPAAHAGKTLDGIKARGQVVCGVNTGLAGFAMADASGKWSGLDVDVCRALAAAVLGDGHKVKYVPVDVPQRFTALQSGEVDVLSRNTTFSLTRDASLGLHQTVVTYYDGQGFIVPAKSKIKSTRQLKGQTVCVQSGTTTEKNLLDYSRTNGLDVKPVMFEKIDAATSAYLAGRCTAYTTDASGLASLRSTIRDGAATHAILPELISKEPLGPLVRRGDDEWFAVVKWVIYGLIEAEEYGVTQANAEQLKTSSTHPVVQRMLGTSEDTGKLLGLDRDWLLRAVKTTGNYGEIFERNVGPKSALGLPRGLNNQWNKQGLMYAVPIR